METIDMEKYKKGIAKSADLMAKLMKVGQEREEKLISLLVPLLKAAAINQIIAEEKSFYDYCKKESPAKEDLLKEYLSKLIIEFDCNVHRLKEDEMPALAEVINKEPLIYFSIGDLDD